MDVPLDPPDDSSPTLRDALLVGDGALSSSSGDAEATATTFTGVDFYDPAVDVADYRDRIVLAAGVAPTDLPALATALAAAGAAALVARRTEDATPSGEHPDWERSLPVLRHLDGDWAQLADILRSLLSAHSIGHVTGVRMGDLFGLANALATLADGAVSVVDATGQVVGYSTHSEQPIDDVRRRTTLLLQEEIPISSDVEYQSLLRAHDARHFPSDTDQFGRVGIAVRASGELLGSLWVIQVDPSLSARTQRLLEEMEPIAAQHLLRAREDAADRDQRNSSLLRTLLEDERHARSAASQLLIRPEAGCTIVCFRVDTFDGVDAMRGLHRLLHLATSVSSAAFPGSHSAVIGTQVVTLIPGSIAARAHTFAHSVIRTDAALLAGIGTRAYDINGIARSHREAGATAGVLMASPISGDRHRQVRIATFHEMRDRLAILQVTDLIEGLDAAVGDSASILAEHDAAQGTDLSRTMRIYLDHLGSVRETATALHVHQNTVRYRLDVVRNDLGIDLDSPDTRLWLWLRLSVASRGSA
ncbi:DNA-binding PucR family transcriptional regulator [Microbacterium phyllosphaerae]|uniref:DNA-binding PucR family transcriptional regulator n=1 Tax=Microbacterium phyllosphaerae TaxID=124798 RepID=A0ABS4WND8_9MICO|nr:PucR family transcriptional regulator [Microbacterium phyllosphaerae]MBP2377713.1 DNA-binding PucR family transcriptional regulator [Microbacterium phyllosphaerae]